MHMYQIYQKYMIQMYMFRKYLVHVAQVRVFTFRVRLISLLKFYYTVGFFCYTVGCRLDVSTVELTGTKLVHQARAAGARGIS
jgi:hypothetical protein